MQSNYIGPRVRRVLCKSKAGLSHFHTCKKQKLKKKVLKQYSGTLFSALRCLSLNRDLSGTPRAATWLLCLLSYRTPRTVWYPARWRRETGPSIHPNGHPSCKDSCSMIPVPCMWPTHHIARIFSGESIFFLTRRSRNQESTNWLRLFFFFLFFRSFHWQKTKQNNCCMTWYGERRCTEYLPMDILQQTNRQKQIGNISTVIQMDILQFNVIIMCLVFFQHENFWYIHFVVESSWRFVLRSEHDNLQSIRVVKYFILRARNRLFELLEQKVNYCYIIYC